MMLHTLNSGVQNAAFPQDLKMMGHTGFRTRPDQSRAICLTQGIKSLNDVQPYGIGQSPKDRDQIKFFKIGRVIAGHTASYPFLVELTQHFYSSIVVEL